MTGRTPARALVEGLRRRPPANAPELHPGAVRVATLRVDTRRPMCRGNTQLVVITSKRLSGTEGLWPPDFLAFLGKETFEQQLHCEGTTHSPRHEPVSYSPGRVASRDKFVEGLGEGPGHHLRPLSLVGSVCARRFVVKDPWPYSAVSRGRAEKNHSSQLREARVEGRRLSPARPLAA